MVVRRPALESPPRPPDGWPPMLSRRHSPPARCSQAPRLLALALFALALSLAAPTTVALAGAPPQIQVSPDSSVVTIAFGDTALRPLEIHNSGGDQLNFNVNTVFGASARPFLAALRNPRVAATLAANRAHPLTAARTDRPVAGHRVSPSRAHDDTSATTLLLEV